ncbi:hypothetical protein [Methylobacterium planeticum]|uniref:Transcriptional coactivator p15 (PC4) C-terminal domain-containing protein n=1 Tax=Methylobacterium planeticum TaxID=2615211 RepID=A0A6N6MS52_9HYPH|nr:hypothetical protein [Methylobacterium planeticum]KAB1072175.1 hypothetical protein F6X51_17285 [Methylobacterium planeticum]
MSEPRTYCSIRKGNSEEIRVRLAEHHGAAFVDIRTFALLHSSGGEPVPTRNGVCISRFRLGELIAGLQAIEREGSGL